MASNNFTDITGQKHDMLTVIRKTDMRDNRRHILWEILCDCGKTIYLCPDHFRRCKSCGCTRYAGNINIASDISGKRNGILTAIKPTGTKKNGYIVWECLCDCGNIVYLSTADFKRRNSCGCLTHKILEIGQKYFFLTVIAKTDKYDKYGSLLYKCKCKCGTIKELTAWRFNNHKSCGCLRGENHSLSHTKLHNVWKNIKQRCNNRNDKRYRSYGARGISICDEWNKSFSSFYIWSIEKGYKIGLSIDRIDNDGNYEPNNCRWTTTKEQNLNRRCSKPKSNK